MTKTILAPVLRAGAVAAALAVAGCAGYYGDYRTYGWGSGPDYYAGYGPGWYGGYGSGVWLGGGYGGWWGRDHDHDRDRWRGWNGWAGGWHSGVPAAGWHGGWGSGFAAGHTGFGGTMHASAAPVGHGFFGGHGFGGGDHH